MGVNTLQNRDNVPAFPSNAFAITPSDATTFSQPTAVYVNTGGNVVVEPYIGGDATVTFTSVLAGSMLPVLVKRVLAASTAGCIGVY